jgi:RNase P/RNase MRP subunit POP5
MHAANLSSEVQMADQQGAQNIAEHKDSTIPSPCNGDAASNSDRAADAERTKSQQSKTQARKRKKKAKEKKEVRREERRHNSELERGDSAEAKPKSQPSRWRFLKLLLMNHSSTIKSEPLDAVTVYALIQAALQQFLGLMGTAMRVDILEVEEEEQIVWVRVDRRDEQQFRAALTSWAGAKRRGDSDMASWRIFESMRALESFKEASNNAEIDLFEE